MSDEIRYVDALYGIITVFTIFFFIGIIYYKQYDLTKQLLAAFFGVMWGILAAFYVNEKTSQSKNIEKRNILKNSLIENLDKNLGLIRQMEKELLTNVIFYNVDLSQWPLFSENIHLLENNELRSDIFTIFFSLQHLSRKVDRQFEMHYSSFRATKNYAHDRDILVNAIVAHIGVLKPMIVDAINKLGKN